MFEHFNELDKAIELMLEKSTTNVRAHTSAAGMSQEEYDQHKDALEHHAGAIEYYRNIPHVKEKLDYLANQLVPLRGYVKKQLKLEGASAPQITAEDLNMDHEMLKGRTDIPKIVDEINSHLKNAHELVNKTPEMVMLRSHSKRFLAHLGSMLEWHNMQKKGEGAHHPFRGHVSGPELEKQYDSSEYRGHSTPSAADPTKFRTQSITKQGGAKWHPGLPELTSLEEAHGHKSAGTMKKLYPFREIKVNQEPLNVKTFSAKNPPAHIHDRDYATNLTREHKVKYPDGREDSAVGGWHGSKSIETVLNNAEQKGAFKKSNEINCTYFPKVTVARFVLAKNLIKAINPYAGMDDEMFGDYVAASLYKDLGESEQAAILAESAERLEKAKNLSIAGRGAKADAAHRQGVEAVLSGKVVPTLRMEVPARTKKKGEKTTELQNLGYSEGERKRSPYVVPSHVFTDKTHSKVDPEKYKKWISEPATEDDMRAEHASYGEVIKTNPEAREGHKRFVDALRQAKQSEDYENEVEQATQPVDHKATLKELSQAHASGKLSTQDYARMVKESAQQAATQRGGKVAESNLTPEEREVKEADPSYQPRRLGTAQRRSQASEKDLTSIAQGKIPKHLLADKEMFGHQQDEYSEARAQELVKPGKGKDEEGPVASGSTTSGPSPIQMIQEHPGFKAYLKMKEHLLSHYTNPAVRKYMEDKIAQHESQPEIDPAKLAGLFHTMTRARQRAEASAKGQSKLMQDIASAPDVASEPSAEDQEPKGKGTAEVPETMMTPEQIGRLQEVRQAKAAAPAAPTSPAQATAPGLKTADPEYKKKLMAELQAKADAARQKK